MQIKFNYYIPRKYFDKKENIWKFTKPSGKDVMQIGTIEDIQKFVKPTFVKEECPLIQAFTCGYRMTKSTLNFDYWNNVTFTDIDTKNYFKDKNLSININKLHEHIHRQAIIDYPNNYVCSYVTASGLGFRIIWYWGCDKSKDNFDKCAVLTDKYACNIFYSFGDAFKEMIDYDGVLDKCSKSSLQCMYLWQAPLFNDYTKNTTFGEINKDDFDKASETVEDVKKAYTPIVLPTNTDVQSSYRYTINKIPYKVKRKHMARFADLTAIKALEPNKDKALKLWWYVCGLIDHDKRDQKNLYNQFLTQFDTLDITVVDVNRLSVYGFKINCINIHLSDNQYLGDVLGNLLNMSVVGVNIWQAPTGGGKTTAWINLNKKILESGDTTHKPIAIVEPLISIVKSKYDNDVIDVTRSHQFPAQLNGYGMYVTNFNKFVRRDKDTGEYVPRDGIVEYMSQFGLIVIDESHTLAKDRFRANVLIPFTRVISEISNSVKVIIQTATPMAENELIDIKRKFIITKKPDKDINVSFKRLENNKIMPYYLNSLVQDNVNEGRNTYIYWSNAPVDKLEDFRASYPYPENVGIFHKKDIDGDDSKHNVSTYHVLDSKNYKGTESIVPYKYNVFLSSVYFGVGNDLDDPEDAAVIIVGLKTWQEIIQVIGRFRNSKNIVVYIILTKSDCEFLDSTIEHPRTLQQRIKYWKEQYANIWYDKENKDKSITIYGQSYMLFSDDDVWPYAVIMASEQHNQTMKAIVDNLTSEYYNIKVDDDYTQFLYIDNDKDAKKRHTKFANQLKKVRDKTIRAIMEGKINDKVKAQIHKDTKLAKFKPLYDSIKQYGIHKLIDADFIAARSNWKMLSLFINIYKKLLNRKVEYEELYAFVWYRMQVNTDDIVKVWDRDITKAECNAIFAYIIFVCLKNKDKSNYKVKGLYFKQFKNKCKLFATIPNELIDMLWKTKSMYESVYQSNLAIRQFFEDDYDMLLPSSTKLDNTKISSLDDVAAQTTHNIQYYIDNNKEVSYVLARIFNLDNVCVKAGGKAGVKKCVILKAMPTKKLSKYGLNVGDEFESGDELADKTGVKKCTITTWRKKKWIE